MWAAGPGGAAKVAESPARVEQADLEADFRLAMRRTAAGVAIITTRREDASSGITVSSFGSLSMDPPSVLACVHGESRTLSAILEAGVFAANVLADHQSHLAEVFSGSVSGDQRFDHGDWDGLHTGAPVLRSALASFDCRLATTFAFGSHRIIVGEVLALRTAEAKPLLYHAKTYGRFGA